MFDGFQLDPYTVLGLAQGATVDQIRDAFRTKSKKHHPDLGGDEWAFRIVVRAYELLGEGRAPGPISAPKVAPSGSTIPRQAASDVGQVRPGVVDRGIAPVKVVAVEILWMRYEVEDMTQLLTLSNEKRSLSGSIHISWPDPNQQGLPSPIPDADLVLKELGAAFENLKTKTKAIASQVSLEGDRFEAWASYPSGSLAFEAFKTLHLSLKLRSLGVRQWTRDLTIPRDPS